jgi:hypothetical protein
LLKTKDGPGKTNPKRTHFKAKREAYREVLNRREFPALLAAQALGLFNNNAYKAILTFYVIAHAPGHFPGQYIEPSWLPHRPGFL